jgi:hypothetical protein
MYLLCPTTLGANFHPLGSKIATKSEIKTGLRYCSSPEGIVTEEEEENLLLHADVLVQLTIGANHDPLLLNLGLNTNDDLGSILRISYLRHLRTKFILYSNFRNIGYNCHAKYRNIRIILWGHFMYYTDQDQNGRLINSP